MAEPTVTVALISAGGTLLTMGGVEIIKAVASRRPKGAVKAETESSLVARAQAYAEQMEEDARQARADTEQARDAAGKAWEKANAAERKAHIVSREVDDLKYGVAVISRYLNWLLDLIGEPSMDIQRLRREIEDRKPPVEVGGQQ